MPAALAAVILAAGQGTRMKSALPKVLHPVAGQPMLAHVVAAARAVGAAPVVAVIGHGADRVKAAFADCGVGFALQAEQLGTGHALRCAVPELTGFAGDLLLLCGDVPLLRGETLAELVLHHRAEGATVTVLTAELADPRGYGRIIRGAGGSSGLSRRRMPRRKSAPCARSTPASTCLPCRGFSSCWPV